MEKPSSAPSASRTSAFTTRPGEVAVKVDCEPLVPRGITYRRASEEEALADCYAYLLLRAKRLKVELETLEGEPLDLTPPWETLEGYPDPSNDTGREALFARLRGMLDPLELSRANFERAFGPQEGEEIEQEEED
ncbi:hypothetical protein [Limibacillus halophilus]